MVSTNRGVDDACVVVCDGLEGLRESIEATWPLAVIQTCEADAQVRLDEFHDKWGEQYPAIRTSPTWMNRWKPALNAFVITFEGRLF